MADDGGGHKPPGKPVSLLTLALQQHKPAPQPTSRPRSRNFYGEREHFELTGHDIHEMRREWATETIARNPVQPFLHSLTHGGTASVDAHGLVPKNMRGAKIKEDSQASSNNNTDVFVAGPHVAKKFFHLGPLTPPSTFVHVVGQSHDFMSDPDYHQYVGKTIPSNDSVMYQGPIPPLREAQYGDTGPKSFMTPMSPRTRRGASRYLTGMPGQEDLAVEELKRKFNAKFGEEEF